MPARTRLIVDCETPNRRASTTCESGELLKKGVPVAEVQRLVTSGEITARPPAALEDAGTVAVTLPLTGRSDEERAHERLRELALSHGATLPAGAPELRALIAQRLAESDPLCLAILLPDSLRVLATSVVEHLADRAGLE